MRTIILAAGFAALGASVAEAETIRWARISDALTLDPHAVNQAITGNFMHHIYETLVDANNDGEIVPRLATEWSLKEGDPNVWVFKLRPGVKFHDGADFTAEDVVFSIDRARSEKSFMRTLHANVESVSAVDDLTVEVRLKTPSPIYPNNLTNSFMVDKGWFEKHDIVTVQDHAAGEENHAVRNANGTGPYVLESRDPDVRSVLRLNENHWAETQPQVTEIIYLPIADNATRVAALMSGEVDIALDIPVQDVERLSSTPGLKVETGPENRVIYFGYRFGEPLRTSDIKDRNPFDDPKVREAMDLAIDREAIRDVVMRGRSIPTSLVLPPFVRGWTEDLASHSKQDIEKAKALMAEAGYPDGFSVTLDTPNNRYVNDEAISQAVVGMLAQIGIRATLASRPISQHSPRLYKGESDFYLLGWGVPTFDSSYTLGGLHHTQTDTYGVYNSGKYSNPELDKMIEAIDAEIDMDKRDALVEQAWTIIRSDRPVLAIHNQMLSYAMKDNITLAVSPNDVPRMYEVTFEE